MKLKIAEFLAHYEPHAVMQKYSADAPNPPPPHQWGYCMAADGRIATMEYIEKCAQWYKGKENTNAWKAYAKRASIWLGRPIFDCASMAEAYVKQETGVNVDTKARYIYKNWCNVKSPTKGDRKLTGMPQVPGVAVFSGAKAEEISHIGYLLKKYGTGLLDWYVIQAAGADKGIIITKLSDQRWEWWGVMDKYFLYDGIKEAPPKRPNPPQR